MLIKYKKPIISLFFALFIFLTIALNFSNGQESIKQSILNYSFDNRRPITKSMLAWWAFNNEQQAYLSLDQLFEIEHIYAKNRQDTDSGLFDKKNLERLGNKSLLEKSGNIFSEKYNSAYADCQSKKLERRISPPVRTIISGGGTAPEYISLVISSSVTAVFPFEISLFTASTISPLPP